MSNEEQIEYWNGEAGATWVAAQQRLDEMLAPISTLALDAFAARPGDRVIDVGCGCGATSLALADAGCEVLGADISAPMLAHAQQRVGSRAIRFERLDAANDSLPGGFSGLFSRFGVMFFDQPGAAFANLRASLNPDGRLAFVCWQTPRSNPWMSIAGAAIADFLPPPPAPTNPPEPGPFAFADPDYVRSTLESAGFKDIAIEGATPTLHVADNLDDAVSFQSQVGPLARALSLLEGDQLELARNAAREALAPHMTDAGLDLGSAVWIVTARV
ncbi:MAG: class I SAM-dependent methyltransferase [Pseudomonadaceae bacterium]|nr:class I SAM-dependent methyltransferase [Pseudomonadaceae bacterium]